MEDWVIKIIEEYGYLGIFVLKMLENLFPPIPSEVVLTFGGFMTTYSDLSMVGIIISSTLGSVTGAAILYGFGYYIGQGKIERFIEKWGHLLRLKKRDLYRANAWFAKYGVWAIFFCRFIPLIRSLISIPAGMFQLNFWLFLLLTSLGTFIWNITLVNIGSLVGDSWKDILSYITSNSVALIIIFVILFVIFVLLGIVFIKRRAARVNKN